MTQKFTMVPGTRKPVVASRFTAIKGQRTKVMADVPAGEHAAKVYPWISGLKQVVSGVAQAETKIIREGYGSSAFVNDTDRTIKINEFRMLAIAPTFADLASSAMWIASRMGIKVRHTNFEIVSGWIPCGMLATHNNVLSFNSGPSNFCMSMPTPYYLQAGHPFRIRLRSTNPYTSATDYTFFITLFGKDPKTDKPYELCKQVTIPYRATPVVSDASPQYVDVVFDENRDYPMRDLLLTHINVAATPEPNIFTEYVFQYSQQLEFQFMPPEGPKWMDFADWAPVANLMDQVVASNIVIHRPETSIIFEPGQQIDVDLKVLVPLWYSFNQSNVFEVPLWVTLIGTQEQRGDL